MQLIISDFFTFYIFVILGQLIFIVALIQMAYQRRAPTSMMAWLLAFFLMPYLAIPLYFFVGLRKHKYIKEKMSLTKDKYAKDNFVMPEYTQGNSFEFFTTGQDNYKALIVQIEKAQETIYMTVYKLDIDETTLTILDALAKKVEEGVTVKILLDALGSINLYLLQYKLRIIRAQGIEVVFFMPILKMPFRNYINLRNHRKAFIFDETAVLAGGINLSDTYLGMGKKTNRWEDILFLIEGKAALSYLDLFIADWAYAKGERLTMKEKVVKDFGNIKVQVVPSGPDIVEDPLYEILLKKIYEAKRRIWIVTPYFTPDENIFRALIIAKHLGVDVRLITPRDSDHIIADLGRSSFMRDIEEHGIYVALFEGRMLHAKAMIIDEIGVLGSANISYRSMFLNYEVMSFFYSHEVVAKIESWMEYLLTSSTRDLRRSGKLRRISENLMKLFTPLL